MNPSPELTEAEGIAAEIFVSSCKTEGCRQCAKARRNIAESIASALKEAKRSVAQRMCEVAEQAYEDDKKATCHTLMKAIREEAKKYE